MVRVEGGEGGYVWAMAQKGHELEVGWGLGEVIVGGRGRKGRLLVRIGLGWIVVVVVMMLWIQRVIVLPSRGVCSGNNGERNGTATVHVNK